jgi:hypothetical protein
MARKKKSNDMRRRKREAIRFEDHIYPTIRRRFPAHLGWNIEQERTLKDGSRTDYSANRVKYGKKERAVIEAKNVRELAKAHVDQLDHYAWRYHATDRLVVIPAKTKVPREVREYANDLAIDIVRARGFPKKRKKSFWDLF